MSQSTDKPSAGRRRSSRRRRVQSPEMTATFGSPRVRRAIGVAMGILALSYGAFSWYRFNQASLVYGDVWIGETPNEVVYYKGPPTARQDERNGSETWKYEPATDTDYLKIAGGRAIELGCGRSQDISLCPSALGLSVGDTESDLYQRLGKPSSERLSDGQKMMSYDSLGYDFLLERGTIRRIALRERRRDELNRVRRFLRWIIP